jgi:hypothetical protein
MKKIFFYLSIMFSILCLSIDLLNAQNIDLYAINANNKMLFVKLNPFSANETVIDTTTATSVLSESSTFDYSCHHYIFAGGNDSGSNSLFIIDTTGTILSDIPYASNTSCFQYDMKDQALYALFIDSLSSIHLSVFDPANGNITQINSLNDVSGINSGSVTFNSNTSKYIFIGYDTNSFKRLFVINALNGVVESNGTLTDASTFDELEYDNNTNKLFGLFRYNSSDNLFYFAEMDTLTAGVTVLNPLYEISGIVTSVYDQATSSYIIRGTDTLGVSRLYVINSMTGQIISNSQIDVYTGEIQCDNTKYALNRYHSTDVKNMIPIVDNFSIYPNPSTNILTIESLQNSVIEILTIKGQIIKRLNVISNKINIDISSFPSGVYIIKATTDNGITTEKFIKE